MNDVFQLTLTAMDCGIDEISLQAIEFWSTVCDEEIDLALEAAEAEEQQRAPDETSRYFIINTIVPFTKLFQFLRQRSPGLHLPGIDQTVDATRRGPGRRRVESSQSRWSMFNESSTVLRG